MKLSDIERSHWLDCLNYLFRNGHRKTVDDLYEELLDDYITEQELKQISLESYL